MDVSYIFAPLLGGVIGYITNDIAIRMLFRPHTAKYIFGFRIPFTPGIIPKEKERIAEAIGGVISENLMNQEVLQRYLMSDQMLLKIRTSIDEFFDKQKQNNETVEEFLQHFISQKEINNIVTSVNNNITSQVHLKLQDPAIGEQIAHLAMDHIAEKLSNKGAHELLTGVGGALGGLGGAAAAMFGANLVGRFLGMLREPTEKYLASNINSMMRNDGATIVSNMIQDETKNLFDTPMATLLRNKDEQIAQIKSAIESLYKVTVQEHLPKILQSIDISRIVRERVNEMDVNETEELIFMVMDKELKAIVWLGALLGLIMGSINLLLR